MEYEPFFLLYNRMSDRCRYLYRSRIRKPVSRIVFEKKIYGDIRWGRRLRMLTV